MAKTFLQLALVGLILYGGGLWFAYALGRAGY